LITIFHTTVLVPHHFGPYLDVYGREGWPLARDFLGEPAGAFFVEIGPQQRLLQIWRCADQNDWTARRARLADHAGWRALRASTAEMIIEEFERTYRPAPFMPIKSLTEARDFVELRVYRAHPNVLERFLEIYESEGLPTQIAHLGHCLGYYRSLDGSVDEVAHLWGYSDLNDRIRRRTALFADPRFKSFLVKGVPHFRSQENFILRPAPFWPR
jgi:hypothetical protein